MPLAAPAGKLYMPMWLPEQLANVRPNIFADTNTRDGTIKVVAQRKYR